MKRLLLGLLVIGIVGTTTAQLVPARQGQCVLQQPADRRNLVHTDDVSLLYGVCRNKKCWDGTCGSPYGFGSGGHGCTCAYEWTCHWCYWDTQPNPNVLICNHKHDCLSCKAAHDGNSCPKDDSIGCRAPAGTDASGSVYTTCNNAITKKIWTANIQQVHNEFDLTLNYFGNWGQYLSNAVMECFVHCYLESFTSDPTGNTFADFMQINKKTGTWSYWIKRPFYWQVNFACDNGFQKFTYNFDITVACHPTSTKITQVAGTIQHQTVNIDITAGARNPSHFYQKFSTEEYNCPLLSAPWGHFISKNTLGNNSPTGLDTTIYTDVNPFNRVQVIDSLKYKRGFYQFYVYRSARGGSYIWTDLYTLNVTCGPASTIITETANNNAQEYEVGSNHGFYFQEFTQSTDCPISDYRIIQVSSTTNHARFPEAPNVYGNRQVQQGSQLMLMKAQPDDTTYIQTITFRIEATALGGQQLTTGTKQLKFSCFNNYQVFAAADFSKEQFFTHDSSFTERKYTFSLFRSSHTYCKITGYSLDDDSNPALVVAPTKARFETTCVTAYGSFCREIMVKADALGTYSFWIVVMAEGGVKQSFEVKITVGCASEIVKVTGAGPVKLYDRKDAVSPSDYTWHMVTDLPSIWNSFSCSSTLCPIVSLKIWQDEKATIPMDSNVTLYNSLLPTQAFLKIKSDEPVFNKLVFIQALTGSGRNNVQVFNYTICGFEDLKTTNTTASQDYFYWPTPTDTNQGLEWTYLNSLFKFTLGDKSVANCYDQTLKFFTDEACTVPWVNPTPNKVDLENNGDGTQRIHVFTTNKFTEQVLFMKRETKGKLKGIIKFSFEVCGLEQVSLSPSAPTLKFDLILNQGLDSMVKLEQYQSNFLTTSRLCKPTFFQLFVRNSTGAYTPLYGSMVILDVKSGVIIIKTHQVYSLNFFIASIGHSNMVYLPVTVAVRQRKWSDGLGIINQPPYLRLGIENVVVNITEVSIQPVYSIQLSQFMDDFLEWHSLVVYSKSFGSLTFTNASGVFNKTDRYQIMDYDPERNTIDFKFQGFRDAFNHRGLHTIKVSLFDSLGLYSTYYPNITFDVKSIYLKPIPVKPEYPVKFTAYIENITKYGLVQIKFSKPLDEIGLEMDHVNSSTLEVYVQPYNDYHLIYPEFNTSKLNLTWFCQDIFNDRMILDITFDNPHWISTQTFGYDALVIRIKNTREGLDQVAAKRRLVNDGTNAGNNYRGIFLKSIENDYFVQRNSTMMAPVRRQFQKEAAEKVLGEASKNQKLSLKIALAIGLFISVMSLTSSLYFICAMVSTLQLAIHLPIMNFLFPSNVMIYLNDLVPIMMFDLVADNDWYQQLVRSRGEGQVIYNIRDQVIDLSYESHNPFSLLGTISLVMCFIMSVTAVYFFVLLPLRMCFRVKCLRRIYRYLRKKNLYGIMLIITLEGYLEILITVLLNFQVPLLSFENTTLLRFVGICLLIQCCVFLPLLTLSLGCIKSERLKNKGFQWKWGVMFLNLRTNTRGQMLYNFCFVVRRLVYVFLISEAMFSQPIFQVLSLNFLNLAVHIYFTFSLPKFNYLRNCLEIFNEIQVTLCTYHLMVFSLWVPDMDTQYFMGWVFIILLNSAMLINMIIVSIHFYRDMKLIYIRYSRRIRWYLKHKCKRKPKENKPKPEVVKPLPPPPPDVKIDSYQPQIIALRGGRAVKMVDDKKKTIERVIATKNDEIMDNDNWKHQAAPMEVSRTSVYNFDDIPGIADKMKILQKEVTELPLDKVQKPRFSLQKLKGKSIVSRIFSHTPIHQTKLHKIQEVSREHNSSHLDDSLNKSKETRAMNASKNYKLPSRNQLSQITDFDQRKQVKFDPRRPQFVSDSESASESSSQDQRPRDLR